MKGNPAINLDSLASFCRTYSHFYSDLSPEFCEGVKGALAKAYGDQVEIGGVPHALWPIMERFRAQVLYAERMLDSERDITRNNLNASLSAAQQIASKFDALGYQGQSELEEGLLESGFVDKDFAFAEIQEKIQRLVTGIQLARSRTPEVSEKTTRTSQYQKQATESLLLELARFFRANLPDFRLGYSETSRFYSIAKLVQHQAVDGTNWPPLKTGVKQRLRAALSRLNPE